MITKTSLKELIYQVNGAAIEVHKALGPGLLESTYQKCMEHELRQRDISFVSEMKIPVTYKGELLDLDFRCDLFIEDFLVVELKAIEKVLPVHEAQLITYLRLLSKPKGLIINFNVANIIKEGQKAYVTKAFEILPD